MYNRRAFMRESDSLFSNEENLKIVYLLMIDMDNLETINDLYRHDVGDRYIKAATDVIRKVKNNSHCIIGRLGGDEFVIMWYRYDSQDKIIG